MKRTAVLWSLSALSWVSSLGCEASFQDLRPAASSQPEAGDAGRPAEPREDAGPTLGDLGAPPDAPASQPGERVQKTGAWEGRSDYRARGTVRLVLAASGQYALETSEDFEVSGVPGPVLVLSRRDALGARLDPAQDVELGALRANRGAQSYPLPAGVDDRMWAWIFCKPFGVEVARAGLEEVR